MAEAHFVRTERGAMLPEGWELASLGDLAIDAFGGGTPSTTNPSYWDGNQPWTTSAIIVEDAIYLDRPQRFITAEGLANSSARVAPRGSVLIGTRVGVGKSVVAGVDIAINQDLTALVLKERIVPEFLALALKERSIQAWFEQNRRGSTIKGIPRTDLLNLRIPIPPVDEQRAIVGVMQDLRRAKESTEKVIAATRELKRSLMRHLFTYGPLPIQEAENVPLKETEIGQIPEKWNVQPIGEFASTTSGATPNRARPEYYGGSIPWVKSGELADGPVRLTGETLTPLGLANSSAKLFHPGTLLVAMYGATAGKVGHLEIEACTNQAVCAIFPQGGVADSQFLFYALVHRRDALLDARFGGAQPNVSQTILRNFAVPLPPIEDQLRIVEILSSVDAKITAESHRFTTLARLFDTLLNDLMSGRRRIAHGEVT